MVVRHHVVDVGQSPAPCGQVERETFFLAGEEDDVVEATGLEERLAAHQGTASDEAQDRGTHRVLPARER